MEKKKTYKAIFVSEETHKELKILAAQEGLTLDKYLQLLIKLRLHGD